MEVGACVEAGVGADHGQAGAARARVLRQAHLNQGGKCFPEFPEFFVDDEYLHIAKYSKKVPTDWRFVSKRLLISKQTKH